MHLVFIKNATGAVVKILGHIIGGGDFALLRRLVLAGRPVLLRGDTLLGRLVLRELWRRRGSGAERSARRARHLRLESTVSFQLFHSCT